MGVLSTFQVNCMHIHRSEVFVGGGKAQLSLADLVKGQFCLLIPSTILGMHGEHFPVLAAQSVCVAWSECL